MIGRNELCPCGSGIKFKKCCSIKQSPSQFHSYNDQLQQIIKTFLQEYPKKREAKPFLEQLEKWKKILSPYFNDEAITEMVQHDYLFHHKTENWAFYCKQIRKKYTQPYIRNVLKSWKEAQLVIGRVIQISDDYTEIIDVFTNNTIYVYTKQQPHNGDFIMTYILSDGAPKNTTFIATIPFIPLPVQVHLFIDEIISEFKESKQNSQIFWKQSHFRFWRIMMEVPVQNEAILEEKNDVIEKEENGVLIETKKFLANQNREYTPLLDILSSYLTEKQPVARKEEAIVAGAIRFGQERGLFESLSMTVKEIAERFGVSPSSLNRYYQDLSNFAQVKS